ncbi:translation elongation factor Ts [Candidatus Poriferisodalis sp.]|uniref:translation elongation factor Ts n=1 Tax=Candidatus Poriferisodalis sp. TaxID=3101277 RepID=UPI003B026C4C
MAAFTAKEVQALRKVTGAGMMDAKNALSRCDGDAAAAAQWLRENGIASSSARTVRDSSDGVVVGRVVRSGNGSVGAIVELRCETDFVAKSDGFRAMADQLLDAVLSGGTDAVAEFAGAIDDLRITLKENIAVGAAERFEAPAGACLDAYVHQQNGRGVNAVLVEIDGASPEVAHDVALHIASSRPSYVRRSDVPADVLDRERATLEALSRNEGKPEAALGKIVEGRLVGFLREHTLMEQKFVKDEKRTIADLVGSASVTRFAQVEIGR